MLFRHWTLVVTSILEKPMVTQAQDAYELSDKVSKTGETLVVGYNTPCTPEFEYLRS